MDESLTRPLTRFQRGRKNRIHRDRAQLQRPEPVHATEMLLRRIQDVYDGEDFDLSGASLMIWPALPPMFLRSTLESTRANTYQRPTAIGIKNFPGCLRFEMGKLPLEELTGPGLGAV